MNRATRFVTLAIAAAITGTAIGWLARGALAPAPVPVDAAIKTWKGGETNTCMVTVDGASLQAFAAGYDVVMLCGVERTDADPLTDRAVTVSRSLRIESTDFPIEEAVSGPMRVLLAQRAARARANLPPRPGVLHDETLWYELALLPREVDAFQVRTLGDVTRFGGRRLLSSPRRTVIAFLP